MSYHENAAIERMNYYSDHRVVAAMRARYFTVVVPGPHESLIELSENICESIEDDNAPLLFEQWLQKHDISYRIDNENRLLLLVRSHFSVCPTCSGSGKVVNPAIDAGGLSADDFRNDPGFREDYFSGAFDSDCTECQGLRVVAQCELPEPLAAMVKSLEQDDADHLSERLSELRYGC